MLGDGFILGVNHSDEYSRKHQHLAPYRSIEQFSIHSHYLVLSSSLVGSRDAWNERPIRCPRATLAPHAARAHHPASNHRLYETVVEQVCYQSLPRAHRPRSHTHVVHPAHHHTTATAVHLSLDETHCHEAEEDEGEWEVDREHQPHSSSSLCFIPFAVEGGGLSCWVAEITLDAPSIIYPCVGTDYSCSTPLGARCVHVQPVGRLDSTGNSFPTVELHLTADIDGDAINQNLVIPFPFPAQNWGHPTK